MHLQTLELTNFRCFRSAKVNFAKSVTIMFAENGHGKSSILDALAIAFDEVVKHHVTGRGGARGNVALRREDVRIGEDSATVAIGVRADRKFDFEWSDSIQIEGPAKTRHSQGKRPDDLKSYLERQWNGETLDDAPLAVFYRAHRAFRHRTDPKNFKLRAFESKNAFENALDASAGFEAIQHWFYQVENEELREKDRRRDFDYEDPKLSAVRRAIRGMIPEAGRMGFEAGSTGLSIEWIDTAGRLFLDQLSDGYRTILAMAMDLAVRLVLANPKHEDPLSAQCIVLVDEIDLHLHPRWQQRIIGDLCRTFPGAQWVFTTHSPQVLSTVRPESLLRLRDGGIEPVTGLHTYGVQSHRVLNEIMEVAARPNIPDMEKKKGALMRDIREDGVSRGMAPPLLAELTEILGPDDPFIINAKAEILKRRKSSR
ncbi:MAG: AAA family ATPase [Opitutales bacterium]|nr:AAA family ATPase [Opitutales bacterium]